MGRKPRRDPSFSKVLINDDFTRQLRLPTDFTGKHRGILTENAKLRISSGETWDVRLEQMGDEHYYFTMGWMKFSKDMTLEKFEFLVFWYIGKSTFDVSVYGITGCEKEFNSLGRTHGAEDSVKPVEFIRNHYGGDSKSDQSMEKSSPLYFEILLKLHHRSRVSLAKKFWMAAGLKGKETVGLEYLPKHRYQCVVLDHRPNSYRTDMAKGWPEFRSANGLVYGKTYSFEFKPSKNVIQVKEVKTWN